MKSKKWRISLLLKVGGDIATDPHEPLVACANPVAAGFYIRGPQPRGWHLGQKQVPRFCTSTRSMVLPQTGQGSPPL
jgi:hypothetical protein